MFYIPIYVYIYTGYPPPRHHSNRASVSSATSGENQDSRQLFRKPTHIQPLEILHLSPFSLSLFRSLSISLSLSSSSFFYTVSVNLSLYPCISLRSILVYVNFGFMSLVSLSFRNGGCHGLTNNNRETDPDSTVNCIRIPTI